MGRWSQYNEDDYRLPEGMERVGYDADTQTYTYQDADGSYWEGAPGARYGNLRRVGSNNQRTSIDDRPSESHNNSEMIKDLEKRDWRLFAPFVVLCCVVLLLLFRFLTGGQAPGSHLEEGSTTSCGEHQRVYTIRDKDTCYAIAQEYGMSVDELQEMNNGIDCDALWIGGEICVTSV